MANFAWGGYRNGEIPLSALTKVGNYLKLPGETVGAGAAFLKPVVARQWAKMSVDCFEATGQRPTLSEGFREAADQERRYAIYKRVGHPLAAYPRTSVHGWACSADIGILGRAWIHANAWKYGFKFTVPSEPWHMDYVGNPTIIGSALNLEVIIVALDAKDMNLFLNTLAYTNGPTISQWMKDMTTFSTFVREALIAGGDSMPDGGRSLGESIKLSRESAAEAAASAKAAAGLLDTTVVRNGADSTIALDGKAESARSLLVDLAETGTVVRRLEAAKPAVGTGASVDVDALAKLLVPAVSKAVADTLAKRLES